MGGIHEECGVFAARLPERGDAASCVYYGLYALQHRGQESCGIAVNDDGLIECYKDLGLVGDVFTPQTLASLPKGNMAVGHVRYGTTGGSGRNNCQPIVVNHIKGRMALAHNGNLVNSLELRRELELRGAIFHTTSDTEVISYVITAERISAQSIEQAVERAMYKLRGAYSLAIMSPTKLIAVRDPNGFRPLCIGRLADGGWVVASESCAVEAVHASFVRDVEPGEIVVIQGGEVRSIKTHCRTRDKTTCIFEYIYFARPDSVIDGVGVHSARLMAGRCLARSRAVEADVVIGVPDSGIDAALGYSMESGIPYGVGFVKNRYIGRTFISPGQSARENLVRIKLSPIAEVVRDKRVVVVDDSIVRGTTSERIVAMLREAGARQVHMRVSAPPFTDPCYYGTDIDSKENLLACSHSVEEIARIIGADSLGYLPAEDLPKLIGKSGCTGYCGACFGAGYPTETPADPGKSRFERRISEAE